MYEQLQDLKNLAITDQDQYGGIMSFYKDQIGKQELQIQELLIEKIIDKDEQEKRHQQEWENYRLKNEVELLKKKINEAQLQILEEKSYVFQMENKYKEIEVLNKQHEEKIKYLLKNTNNKNRKILPSMKTKKQTKELNYQENIVINTNQKNQELKDKQTLIIEQNQSKMIFLEQQIEELKQINQHNIKDTQNQIEQQKKEIEQLKTEKQKQEKINFDLNRKYFEDRLQYQKSEQRQNEQLEEKNNLITDLREEIEKFMKYKEKENEYVKKLVESQTNETLKNYKNRLEQKETDLSIITTQYKKVQEIFQEKLKIANAQIDKLNQEILKQQQKKNLEIESMNYQKSKQQEKINELKTEINLIQSNQFTPEYPSSNRQKPISTSNVKQKRPKIKILS